MIGPFLQIHYNNMSLISVLRSFTFKVVIDRVGSYNTLLLYYFEPTLIY